MSENHIEVEESLFRREADRAMNERVTRAITGNEAVLEALREMRIDFKDFKAELRDDFTEFRDKISEIERNYTKLEEHHRLESRVATNECKLLNQNDTLVKIKSYISIASAILAILVAQGIAAMFQQFSH